MISTPTAVRRRTALLAQQRPSSEDNRQQQQEGSTEFQWAQGVARSAVPGAATLRGGAARLPSHRQPARAPVIGAMDDGRREGLLASGRRGSAPRGHDASDAAVQQA
jgi:hypothetical protein